MDSQGLSGPDDPAAYAEAHTAAIREAIAAVEAAMSGRDIPEIEAHLARELRDRDVFLSRDEIHLEASHIADPEWARKDPAALQRLLAEITSPAKVQEEAALEAQWERADEWRSRALHSMWRVRRSSVTSHRTVDGVNAFAAGREVLV